MVANFTTAAVVRKFGTYSGKKEIESIAVDNEPCYVYYSDEEVGERKYYADPAKGNQELAVCYNWFTDDHEGIFSIYSTATTSYILVLNQQDNSFMNYTREGRPGIANGHPLVTKVKANTLEATDQRFQAFHLVTYILKDFVAMINGKVFQIYNWRAIQAKIDAVKR